MIELNPRSVLAILNTQWWMQNWEAKARTNEACALKTSSQFGVAFLGIIKKYRTRRVIVALHHPLESLGTYGGSIPAIEHLEPPLLGSIWVWARQGGLVPQYRNHFLGDHYRNAYALNLDFDVLNLASEQGGLEPLKIGGGNQTNSLRLEDPTGAQWAMRSTSKDASRYLPYPMNKIGFLNSLLEDGFTATHPAAALAVPPMAEAVGVYHTRPRLMYLPDQIGLKEHRGYITDEVVLLERRPKSPKVGELPEHLGGKASAWGPTKYRSTIDMLAKVQNKPWKHRVDQEMMLRARLLDIFLGDWDRHEDQWRFAAIPQEDGTKLYRPIPRDRDQAFAHYDGMMLFVARLAAPGIRVLRPFGEDIGDLTWLTYNGRHIDPVLLNQISRDRWMEIAAEVQAALTDDVIAQGLAQWSPEAYALDGKGIEAKLRSRRDQLVEAAEAFFELRNQRVDVVGSERRDTIDVTYGKDGRVTLAMRHAKAGPTSAPYYRRTFDAADTDELRIYGLSGGDTLSVFGEPHLDIRIRFIGGPGDDTVRAGALPGKSRPERLSATGLSVYDRKKGMEIADSIKVSDARSGSHYHNQYDLNDAHHEPTKAGLLAGFAINPDDGLYLGATTHAEFYGFKRRPYASHHQVSAFFATTTLGVEAAYSGVFPRTLGPFDQELHLTGTTPTHARNFFGVTNRYVDPEPEGREFYRVRQGQAALGYGLGLPLSESIRIGLRAHGRWIEAEATEGRFVVQSPDVPTRDLQGRYFVGSTADARVNTLDNPMYPRRGISAGISATVRRDVTNDSTGTSATFRAALSTHIPFDRSERLVLSTRGRIAAIVGDYPFYFLPTLGDRDLRAYNAEQLAGNAVFSHTTDLRLEMIRISDGLPSAIGIAGSIDHGRAFGPDVPGDKHHVTVGGRVFWSILGTIGLSVGYYRGLPEGDRLVIGLGPLFAETGLEP